MIRILAIFWERMKIDVEGLAMKNNNQHPLKAMALMSSILAQLVGSILIGIFLGRWIDTYFDWPVPVFMIIGLLLGLFTGIYGTLKLIKQFTPGD
jgi:ATP synthase protein I